MCPPACADYCLNIYQIQQVIKRYPVQQLLYLLPFKKCDGLLKPELHTWLVTGSLAVPLQTDISLRKCLSFLLALELSNSLYG